MRSQVQLTVIVMVLAFVAYRGAAEQSLPAPSPGEVSRMVRDALRINPTVILKPADGATWAVIKVTPDTCSITENTEWAMTEDGIPLFTESVPNAGQQRVIFGGAIKVLAVLKNKPGCIERFEEVGPGKPNGPRSSVAERMYSPFENSAGGVLICRVNDGFPGIYRFAPAMLIDPHWDKWVKPAIDYTIAHPEILNGPLSKVSVREQLVAALGDTNPFVKIFACRTLAASQDTDGQIIQIVALEKDIVVQGAFSCLLLTSGSNDVRSARASALAEAIGRADSIEAVRGIAAAILATLVDLRGLEKWEFGRPLIDAFAQRCRGESKLSEFDARLNSMIEATAASHLTRIPASVPASQHSLDR